MNHTTEGLATNITRVWPMVTVNSANQTGLSIISCATIPFIFALRLSMSASQNIKKGKKKRNQNKSLL